MKENVISVGKQTKYLTTLNGFAWICAGIFSLFDNVPCEILKIVSLACSLILLLRVQFYQKENDDEMSIKNMTYARAATQKTMHYLLLFATLVCMLFFLFPASRNINVKHLIVPIFFLIVGIEDLLIGHYFKHFEKE